MAVSWREQVGPGDAAIVRHIVEATGMFRPDEVAVAVELVEERRCRGPASGYDFIFAEENGVVLGYACYGPIACTLHSYDLYWIAVAPAHQGRGLGRRLLVEVERRIASVGGHRVYIETSSRPQYDSTRAFYERCGYRLEARLADFYAPGDDKAIYVKAL